MSGTDLLDSVTGEILADGKVQLFYLDGELVNKMLSIWLRFGKKWLRFISTDEMTKVYLQEISFEEERNTSDWILNNSVFEYPIEPLEHHFPAFISFLGKRLVNWKELVLKENYDLSFGVKFYFEDGLSFTYFNLDYPLDFNQLNFEGKFPPQYREK